MRARNRELLGLIPASLLITAGFAGVFIQRSNKLSNVSLTYGAVFLGLCVAGHIFIRDHAAPRRPVHLPARRGARVLRARDGLPDRRRDARPPAGAVVRARAGPVRRHGDRVPRLPQARALPVPDRRPRRSCCSCCRGSPASAYQINGAYLGVRVPGLVAFQPTEFAKVGLVVFLASYLRDTRQVLVEGARGCSG